MSASTYLANLRAKRILVKLPLPGGFDQWLSEDYFTVLKDHLPNSPFQWGDVASNEVLCTVQMSITTVSFLIQYTIDPTHNLSSIRMTSSRTSKHTA